MTMAITMVVLYLAANSSQVMNYVLLNAFYDAGNKVGNILAWVFILLMFIEVVYVMAKYLGPSKK